MNAQYIANKLREANFERVGLDERRSNTYVHFTPVSPKRSWESRSTGSSIIVTERGIGSATVRMPAVEPEKRWDAEDAARVAAEAAPNYYWTIDVKQGPMSELVAAHVYLHHNQDVRSVDNIIEDVLRIRSAYQGAMYS